MRGGQRAPPSQGVTGYRAELLVPGSWGESGENGGGAGEKATEQKVTAALSLRQIPDLLL